MFVEETDSGVGFRIRFGRKKKRRKRPAFIRKAKPSAESSAEPTLRALKPRPPELEDDYEGEEEEDNVDYETAAELEGDDVLGDDVLGYQTVGRRRRRRARGRTLALPPKPAWRSQLAPGVPSPGEGLQPLPLRPNLNNGVFSATVPTIAFEARPQVPFHAERLLTSVRRTGAAGVIIQAQNLFVGRDLQLVELGQFDVEFFSPTAFGVRLQLDPAQPGVLITLTATAVPAVTGTDTVAVSMMFLGRSIR